MNSLRLRSLGARFALLAVVTALSACGGGGGDNDDDDDDGGDPQGFTGDATGYPTNAFGTAFDTTEDVAIEDGEVTVDGEDTGTYTAPASAESTVCTFSDPGSPGTEQCTARAAGRLVLTCDADGSGAFVSVGRTPTSGTFESVGTDVIPAAAGAMGMRFDALACNGSLNAAQTVLVRSDGSATFTVPVNGVPTNYEFSAAEVNTQYNDRAGLLRTDLGVRIGGEVYRYTPAGGGTAQLFFLSFGAPQSAGDFTSPFLYVQRP